MDKRETPHRKRYKNDKHMKRCSIASGLRELLIEMRQHYIPITKIKIKKKKTDNTNAQRIAKQQKL